jgi:hypothetical protein
MMSLSGVNWLKIRDSADRGPLAVRALCESTVSLGLVARLYGGRYRACPPPPYPKCPIIAN